MIDYQYAGTTSNGAPCQGRIRAASVEAARLRLIGQGITPLRIGNGSADVHATAVHRPTSGHGALRRADVLLFTRELAHLTRANLPLDRALAMLREIATTERLRDFVSKVTESVRGGKSLHHALGPFEAELGRRYLVQIRAAEASGALSRVLGELAAQLEAEDKLRSDVISAMTYPFILIGVAVVSVVVLLLFVVPQFREIFDSMGDALPYLTRLVLDVSDGVRRLWMVLLVLLSAIGYTGWRWGHSPAGRLQFDRAVLRLPLLGKVVLQLQLSVYFRTFGSLLQRGVPLVESLRISADAVTNQALRLELEPLVDLVRSGRRLSTGFSATYFTPFGAAQLIRVAEETGSLAETTLALAERCEQDGRRTMGRLLAAMEPLIIILLGVVVAIVIIAILGGVMSISDTV